MKIERAPRPTLTCIERDPERLRELQVFVVRLGAAMNAAGEPVYSIQDRLAQVARAHHADAAQITAFPTYLMVTLGPGEPAVLELTSVAAVPRLDQLSALDRLVDDAASGSITPGEGRQRLDAILAMPPRYGRWLATLGYAVLAVGLCLVLKPAPRDVVAAAVFGAAVGVLRSLVKTPPAEMLLPLVAAFCVSAMGTLAIRHGITGPGLRSMVAALVVFLPGATLTTSVLELAAGQVVSGSSRFISGVMSLAMLAFGILAGIEAGGLPSEIVLAEPSGRLGAWAPPLGVAVFAVGVTVANSAPPRALPALLIVLYAAWGSQLLADHAVGGYVSAMVGALVMSLVAAWVSRLRSAMPQQALFLPGFWLLVPGALGLIGFTKLADAGAGGAADLVATAVTIFAIAVGVLCGALLLGWLAASGRYLGGVSAAIAARSPLLHSLRSRAGDASDHEG